MTRFVDVVRERGPMTVAAFMDLALYDPVLGYYARAAQRSGRAGDFFTSVDVGPLFGDLLELQICEMAGILQSTVGSQQSTVDLVEAGAGNGRLAADILRSARDRHPDLFARLHLHLVEASPEARRAQRATLDEVSPRLVSSSDSLPDAFEGILVANEWLDALPVHQVVMRDDGLREVYVHIDDSHQSSGDSLQSTVFSHQPTTVSQPAVANEQPSSGRRLRTADGRRLTTIEGPLSTPALEDYLTRLGVALESGWRVEINLRAVEWIRRAARRLRRGFILLFDYGHEARVLYSASHAGGTLTTFARHHMAGPERSSPSWLDRPGDQDITAHIDFTSVRAAAEDEGLVTLGFLDQTYFVLGLVHDRPEQMTQGLALKTLMMPGGLGSTHKVLILGKGVGHPSLRSCSFGQRVT